MPLFRRQRSTSSSSPAWATGSGSPIGPVPASVVAAVVEGRLPPEVAACVDGGARAAGPNWLDVGDVVKEMVAAGTSLSGPLYAMGAYGQLDGCFTMVDETAERAERAAGLLDLAEAHGVAPEELQGLRSWAESLAESGEQEAEEVAERATQDPATMPARTLADRAYDVTNSADPEQLRAGAELYAQLAERSAGDPDEVLDASLRRELALHRVGDRQALPRLAELAEASSDRLDTAHLLDSARLELIVDAATTAGPEAARDAWVRARRQSERFPGPGFQERLVEQLAGRRVPGLMSELAALLRARDHPDRDVRKALRLAESELAEDL